MRFADVVLDTSLLVPPTARRFFMAAWQLQGMEVPVLPRVIRELHGVLPDSERGHWTRVLAGQAKRTGTMADAATTNRILDAVDAASESWVHEKLDAQYGDQPGDAQPCALRAVRLDDDELARARAIGDAIPAACFRGPSRNDHFGDRQIIGQAAVKGYRVLALNNRNSIRRVAANGWLREHAGANEDLLWDSDEAVYRLQSAVSSEPDVETLKAVLHACLPDRLSGSSREDEIVVQFLDRMARAGLGDCAAGAASVWRTPAGKELASEARAGLADSVARQTEASRVAAVRSAAERAGWRPEGR